MTDIPVREKSSSRPNLRLRTSSEQPMQMYTQHCVPKRLHLKMSNMAFSLVRNTRNYFSSVN